MTALSLRRFAIVLLWIYVVQFIAGMTLNLFVALPASHSGTTGNEYFSRSLASLIWALTGLGGPVLFLHALIGVGLVLGSLVLFIFSCRIERARWRWASGITCFFTIGGLFNGLSFLDYTEDVSSAIMAACWLVAIGALVFVLVAPPALSVVD
ncbi:hypothetical protein [Glaciibacter psychrotolerans]|uniref:Uncharacterized protein n=1 Tax=Glaciibacter psychrotolerans TaxID=670054 RepID=A0A7Z0EE36_9MICO|nr:hypothetical protein [Leifsonia psychrotolerans]NYJ19968.1 hypothetical protein [Leifsonia psychrotolerans]